MNSLKTILKRLLIKITVGYFEEDIPEDVKKELEIDKWKNRIRNPPYKKIHDIGTRLFFMSLFFVGVPFLINMGVTMTSAGISMFKWSIFFLVGYTIMLIGKKVGERK